MGTTQSRLLITKRWGGSSNPVGFSEGGTPPPLDEEQGSHSGSVMTKYSGNECSFDGKGARVG